MTVLSRSKKIFLFIGSLTVGFTVICLLYLHNVSIRKTSWYTTKSDVRPRMSFSEYRDSIIPKAKVREGWTLSPNNDTKSLFDVIQNWPVNKPKAVICILTYPDRKRQLYNILSDLDSCFTDKFDYPVVIFYTDNFTELIPSIRSKSRSNLFFIPIEFRLPEFLLPRDQWPETECPKREGYKHMCRFHAKTLFELPWVRQLEYYWRLDDDSHILAPINYDVFSYMRENGFLYGYFRAMVNLYNCTVGLKDIAQKYMQLYDIKSDFIVKRRRITAYYNNFEISAVSIWTTPQYKEYIDLVDKAGGIFYHSWGDAPIKSLATRMFVPREKIHHFKDIHYQHKGVGYEE